MTIGKAIKTLRKLREVRQADLAEKTGITQSYLSQIENDKKEPHISTLEAIAGNLGLPLPALLFLALEESDVPDDRKDAYALFYPKMKALIFELCEV